MLLYISLFICHLRCTLALFMLYTYVYIYLSPDTTCSMREYDSTIVFRFCIKSYMKKLTTTF